MREREREGPIFFISYILSIFYLFFFVFGKSIESDLFYPKGLQICTYIHTYVYLYRSFGRRGLGWDGTDE